jgi:hypothetical protein
MSKPNKANRNNYMQAGRLTPDQMARERAARAQQERVKAHSTEDRRPPRAERVSSRRRSAPEE